MKYYYLILMLGSVFFPFVFSFDKKVHFFTYATYFLRSIPLVALLFILGDILYTYLHVWGFNQQYVTGLHVLNLPIEEVLFFLIVPYACLFIYQVLKEYFPQVNIGINSKLLYVFSVVLLVLSIYFRTLLYTALSFLGAAVCLLLLTRTNPKIVVYTFIAYAISLIPFIIVNGALTGLFTEQPVVFYNNAENLGIRITTIPLEDFFYSFNLLVLNILLFEWLQNRNFK